MIFRLVDWLCYRLANAVIFLLSVWPRRNAYDWSKSKNKKHVLLVANEPLGDSLVRLPLYATLRRAFPPETHHLAVMLTPAVGKLLSPLHLFDEIVEARMLCCSHPIRWIFSKDGFVDTSLKWAFSHKLDVYINPSRFRSLGHDYILSLTKPTLGIAYETLCQSRVFPATAAYQKRKFDHRYTHLLPIVPNSTQIDEMQKLVSFATGVNDAKLAPVPCSDIQIILDSGIADNLAKPYIVLVPGAGADYRRWPVDRFSQIATRLGGNIVVVGTKEEFALGEAIFGAVNLCGKTTLPQLGGILAGADLVIANETGTATYAAVIGARTLCLVGGGDFNAFFPNAFYKNTRSVYNKEACFSCMWNCSRTDLSCSIAPCINSISVDDVYAVAKEMLSDSRTVAL